jgi:hypothetical protein
MSWLSCISVGYRGCHVLVWDIEVVMYWCGMSWLSCISVGYRGGHVLVWDIVVVMY